VFRNGEAGRSHNPEFTLLEWYRVGWDHHRLMDECAELAAAALALAGRATKVNKIRYINWFRNELDLDPNSAGEAELRASLAEFGIDPHGLTRDDWLDLLITHRLQPKLSRDAITLVYDYPATQCALAKLRQLEDEPPTSGSSVVAERFELYLGRYELANGYHELNDAAEQRARFERDNARRRERGLRELPLDERLLSVLDDMPDCAGVALGVDRLLMCLLGTDDIRDVLAFPFAEA
jgi:lysyl-tRNA synthetase class 2